MFVVAGACGSVAAPNSHPVDSGDANGDAAIPRCSSDAAFGAPVLVPGANLNTSASEINPQLTPDELGLYFVRQPGDVGGADIYVATRSDINADFGNPIIVPNVNGATTDEVHPTVTADGLTMYLSTNQAGSNSGGFDVFVATRGSPSVNFSMPVPVTAVSSAMREDGTYVLTDGHALYLSRYSSGPDEAIYRATLGATGFSAPVLGQGLGAVGRARTPVISVDERTIFFAANNGGTDIDIWTAAPRRTPRSTRRPASMS